MTFVSVLMPCHNVAATIDETMRSLIEQTHAQFEIVAVDDGSTDNSLELLQAWAQRDERVRVLQQAHTGIIEALNTGLKACQGDYIARMDADDLAHPQRLEKQAAFLDSRPEIAVASCLVEGFPKDELRQGYRIDVD